MPPIVLVVDRYHTNGPHRAASREEALQLMTAFDYETIELWTATPARDDYGLVNYLAGTWPSFFAMLSIRTVTAGSWSAQWNHKAGLFEATTSVTLALVPHWGPGAVVVRVGRRPVVTQRVAAR